jgi:hypothetical protein
MTSQQSACLLTTLVVEAVYHLDSILAHEDVVVPRVAVSVHKDDSVGEVVVAVGDVADVDLVTSLTLEAPE